AQRQPVAAVMAHFSRLFQHFASAGDTRYDLADQKDALLKPSRAYSKRGLSGTILSSRMLFL
ncbi:MAG TPA: hypothetical protein VFX32_13935, partial [Pseudolabrys sp.]|nr:hypothetical protein [Pseudolabrys sp.]